MTPDEMNALTLGELESIAKRLDEAVRLFRDARSMLGAPAQHLQPQPITNGNPSAGLLPHELAMKEVLLSRNRELPPELQAAERMAKP